MRPGEVSGFFLMLSAAVLCAACVTLPQSSEQWISGRHVGTVVDASTGKPLQGARVRLVNFPGQSATTDATGKFVLGPVIDTRGRARNLFTGVEAAACVDRIEVERPGYVPASLDKGDNKTFRAACQNAVFEYQLHLNPAK